MSELNGPQIKQMRDAFLSAYTDRATLAMMVRIELNRNLNEIAGGETLTLVVYNLIGWAERSGCVDSLIEAALRDNPGNPAFQALAKNTPKRLSGSIVHGDTGLSNHNRNEMDAILLNLRGHGHYGQGDLDAAIQDYDQALARTDHSRPRGCHLSAPGYRLQSPICIGFVMNHLLTGIFATRNIDMNIL